MDKMYGLCFKCEPFLALPNIFQKERTVINERKITKDAGYYILEICAGMNCKYSGGNDGYVCGL